MKKLLNIFPPFKKEDQKEIQEVLDKAFKDVPNELEFVILHDCSNPQCPMGTVLGVIGTEEDEIVLRNFVMELAFNEALGSMKLAESFRGISKSKIKFMEKSN